MRFGDRLSAAIKKSASSQAELARHLGVGPSTISNYINNIREPDLDRLRGMAEFLSFSADELIGVSRPEPAAIGFAEAQAVFEMPEPPAGGFVDVPEFPAGPAFIFRTAFEAQGYLPARTYCLVEPDEALRAGSLVVCRNFRGQAGIGRYVGQAPSGWPIVSTYSGIADEQLNPALYTLAPITWTGYTSPPRAIVLPDCPAQPAESVAGQRYAALELARIVAELQDVQRRMET